MTRKLSAAQQAMLDRLIEAGNKGERNGPYGDGRNNGRHHAAWNRTAFSLRDLGLATVEHEGDSYRAFEIVKTMDLHELQSTACDMTPAQLQAERAQVLEKIRRAKRSTTLRYDEKQQEELQTLEVKLHVIQTEITIRSGGR